MDIDLPSNHRQPPAMALAVATIVAAGVTGLAVAGLTWTLDRPTAQSAVAPPDMTAFDPTPSTNASIDTPGWAEALGLPPPAPVAPVAGGPAAVEGVGTATQPSPTAPEEAARRAAAARRPIVGPTASANRSTPTATGAATSTAAPTAAPPGTSATSAPGALDSPDALDSPGGTGAGGFAADPAPGDPATAGDPAAGLAADPDGDVDGDVDAEPVPTETVAPGNGRRRWDGPRRTWQDEPRPAPAQQWGGPFGGVPNLFPWG